MKKPAETVVLFQGQLRIAEDWTAMQSKEEQWWKGQKK